MTITSNQPTDSSARLATPGIGGGTRAQSLSLLAGVAAVVLVIGGWALLKAVLPKDGVKVGDTLVLPRTDDGSMPSPLSVFEVLFKPTVDIPGAKPTGVTLLEAMLFSLRLAGAGFLLGVIVGTLLGLLMYRFKTAELALLPYVVVAPTVPILAIAPLVAAWSGKISFFGNPWQPWMSVALITSYLCFLPIAAGLLRGLSSPSTQSRELMRCLAASRWSVITSLELPSAVPFIIPALKLAAAASVVGSIVAELSTGTSGGVGRLIVDYIPSAASDGSRLFAAVIAAALLGIIATSLVSAIELPLGKYQQAPR